jgi:putative hemolysin
VVDHQFNTTDVCVVVKTDQVNDKYYRHYDRDTATRGGRSADGGEGGH